MTASDVYWLLALGVVMAVSFYGGYRYGIVVACSVLKTRMCDNCNKRIWNEGGALSKTIQT